MINKNVASIRKNMNACGRDSRPFFFAVNFDLTEGLFIEYPLEQNEIAFQIRGQGNKHLFNNAEHEYRFSSIPIPEEEYFQMFSDVQRALKDNYISVVNLTVKTPLDTDLTLFDIFMKSRSLYQVYVPNHFVCFSPEQFVKIADGKIYTNPMKGTIDASIPNAEEIILGSEKEKSEHCIVVEMVEKELKDVATEVRVSKFRYIDRIHTQGKDILQTSSEITGVLSENYLSYLGDIIFKMLPASSILGVPKLSAKEIIEKVEKEARGYYTGVCGYFDGEEFNSGVLIRFIEQSENKLYFRSGGGITIDSDSNSEYQEVLNKIYLPK